MNNTVELLGFYGGDKTHALSAWTSTFEELNIEIPESVGDRIDTIFDYVCQFKKKTPAELLEMLATAGHHTPFEKSCIHFLVTSDVASHIHKLKHRIAVAINGESARYKELQEDKFYLPDDWEGVEATADVCIPYRNSERIFTAAGQDWQQILKTYTELGNRLYHQALKDLEGPLGRKRAKESARYFKNYTNQTTVDIMFNWRSFAHFQNLRNDSHAQLEIREIAKEMLDLVKGIEGNPFEQTIKAFGFENR